MMLKTLVSNKQFIVTVTIVVLVVVFGFAVWKWGKASNENRPGRADLPNGGSGVPAGWSPTKSVTTLHNAMDGLGTDEDAIFGALENLTRDQLIMVYNEFNAQYAHESNGDLIDWFNSELSGSDLQRALNYYQGIL